MTIDHMVLYVPEDKHAQCLQFYAEALKPLGYEQRQQYGEYVVGFGGKHHTLPDYKTANFWILGHKDMPKMPAHTAFTSQDRATVDAFHAAAIKAGGVDNGAPGLRQYHPDYYAAFVYDPAGNNIEVVCHRHE
ncbi:hypothetical protein QQS21_010794 [Conoideocrella luteorostrata]|uniref:VOC domain-containing protein n=1 Tax=Conoideocrella luteorostrata TaxID=1105319 RepID=A0AAJ0CEH8_9HYPO|nr:hypothetical protein QQS21_010794 [Conoideocrella luteorostrata]